VATDAAGNGNTAATQFLVSADVTPPTLAITGPAGPVGGPFDVTFTFSEDVTGFELSDIAVVRNGSGSGSGGVFVAGAATNFQTINAREYTATITPTSSEYYITSVGPGRAVDAAGNGNSISAPNPFAVLADLAPPSVSVSTTTPPLPGSISYANGPFNVTVSFNEDVTGFSIDDIVVIRREIGSAAESVVPNALSDFQAVSARVYTAILTPPEPSYETVYYVDIPVNSATDVAGNGNSASSLADHSRFLRIVDNDHPTLIISRIGGAVTALNGPFQIYIRPPGTVGVTGLTIEDVIVSNATTSDFEPQGAGGALLMLTPIAEGPVTVDVPANSVIDSFENGNIAATQFVVEYDLTPPSVVISGPPGPISGAFTATFTFNEDVTGFAAGDISIGNGAASNVQATSASVYTTTITPAADGAVTLDVGATIAEDLAGNGNTAATQVSVTNDETGPTVAIAGPPGPVSGVFTATFTFNEDVTGFAVGDISVGNGAASNFQPTSARDYTATITPTADGAVTVDVPGTSALDAAGNDNTAAPQFSVTNDQIAPTGYTFEIDQDPITQANVGAVSLTFAGFELGSTYSYSLSSSGGGTPFTGGGTVAIAGGTLPPIDASTLPDGIITASVTLTDAAGNAGLAVTGGATKDATGPSLLITGPAGPVSGAFDVVMVFSDPIQGLAFVDDPFTITNGSFGDSELVDALTARQQVLPDADGLVVIDFNADAVADALGNLNTGATLFSVSNDQTSPGLTITGPSVPVNTPALVTFTFDEDVTGFTIDDLNISGGIASNFAATSATVYTALIGLDPIAAANQEDGVDRPLVGASGYRIDVSVNADTLNDVAGNSNAASGSFPVYYDTVPPVARISAPSASNGPFTVNFTFEESVTGFTADNVIVGNGTLSGFTQTYDCGDPLGVILGSCEIAAVFEAEITPLLEGQVTIDVPDNAFVDVAGNSGSASVQRTVSYDTVSPTTAITGPTGPASGAFTATFTFNENVSNFVLADITVGNGVASNFQAPSASLYNGQFTPTNLFTATITPAADGDVTVDVAGSVASDAAGNNNAAATQFSVTNDETAPTLAITGPTGPVSGVFTATFTFDEDVSDFVVGDITVGNGAASALDDSAAPIYTATITPTADGPVTLDVAGSVATDAAGNDNTAATQFSITNDETAPTLAITGPTGPVSGAFTATFTFDEDVTDFVVGDISVGNGAASAFDDSAAPVYTATITPAADGAVTLDVAGSVATDAAGNDNTAATQFSITNDETAPTLAITGPTGPVSGAFTATFTFDGVVSEFTVDDITVDNGTASDFEAVIAAGDDVSTPATNAVAAQYTAIITPAADGAVTIDVAGAIATDAAGNDNAAATQFSVTNDETAPVLTAFARDTPVTEQTDADSLIFAISFDEPVSNVTAVDFTVIGTTATGVLAGADDSYTLTVSGGDLADLNGSVGLDLAAGQDIADAAGNALGAGEPATDETYNVLNDADAPTVASVTRSNPTTENTNADSLVWLVRFSEDVTDIDTGDFAVSGTTGAVTDVSPQAMALPPSVTGEGYSAPLAVSSSAFVVTASGGDLASFNGAVALSFAQGQDITDGAGNALTNTTPTGANDNSYTLDNTAPTVALTTTATAPVSGPFTLTATFSEDVTGFDVSDLTVGNGAASNFAATSATVYTATITPGAGSSTTVDVASAAATDAVGNDSTAASQFSITHDPDRTLSVSLPGVGSGTVTSAPTGISCGTDCTEDYAVGTSVTLTAAADTGSTFAGWTAGPCIGTSTATCAITMSADTSVSARFTLDTPPAGRIVAATLPGARSGYVGGPVISAFLSVVSRTSSPAQSCQVTAPAGAPVTLGYNQLDTNGDPVGPDSPLFDIDPGGALNFVIGMTPTTQTGPDGYSFLPVITCQNASLDPIVGVNDVLLNIGPAPTPDILSIAATPSGDGVIRIATPGGLQFMSASALNIGVGDGSAGRDEVTLTTTVDTGAATLPVAVEICQINASAICISPRGSSVTSNMAQNTPLFFAAFVRDTSTGGIPFDPANSRVFLRFTDATGVSRSATSAAVTAPAPADAPDIASSLPQGRWSVLMRQPDGVWPGLARTSLYVTETGQVLIDDGTSPRLMTLEVIAADADQDGTQARFMALGHDGLWTNAGSIRLGAPWAEQVGEFWGVRDARSDVATSWTDLAGNFGGNLILSQTGEIRGNIDGCAVYGQASGPATQAATLSLSGCAQSGFYLGLVDLPANDNGQPALLIANGTTGWRVGR
jgi:hypothetical protein